MELNEYDVMVIKTLIVEELQVCNDNDTKWIKELSVLLGKIENILSEWNGATSIIIAPTKEEAQDG